MLVSETSCEILKTVGEAEDSAIRVLRAISSCRECFAARVLMDAIPDLDTRTTFSQLVAVERASTDADDLPPSEILRAASERAANCGRGLIDSCDLLMTAIELSPPRSLCAALGIDCTAALESFCARRIDQTELGTPLPSVAATIELHRQRMVQDCAETGLGVSKLRWVLIYLVHALVAKKANVFDEEWFCLQSYPSLASFPKKELCQRVLQTPSGWVREGDSIHIVLPLQGLMANCVLHIEQRIPSDTAAICGYLKFLRENLLQLRSLLKS